MEQLNSIELRGVVSICRVSKVADKTLVRFGLATSNTFNGKDNTPVIETNWHSCHKFLNEGEAAPEKGDKVYVKGRLRYERYVGDDGRSIVDSQIIVHEMQILPKDARLEPETDEPMNSNTLRGRLSLVGEQIQQAIKDLLKSKGLTRVNVAPYIREGFIDNYNFYDCDKDGNGEALELQKINVNEDGNVELEFDTNYGDYFQCSELSSLITSERLYVLEMLENIIAYSEEENIPVLKEDEDFDDYEDENCRI